MFRAMSRSRRAGQSRGGWVSPLVAARRGSRDAGVSMILVFIALGLLFVGVSSGAAAIAILVSADGPHWRGAGAMSLTCIVLGLGLWIGAHRLSGGAWGLWLLAAYGAASLSGLLLVAGAFFTFAGAFNIITLNITNEMTASLGGGLAALGLSFVLKRFASWAAERPSD